MKQKKPKAKKRSKLAAKMSPVRRYLMYAADFFNPKLKYLRPYFTFLLLKTGVLELLLLATLISGYYWTNRTFTYVSEMALPFLLLAPFVLLFHFVFLKLHKNYIGAHLSTIFMTLSLYNFEYNVSASHNFVQAVFPFKLSNEFQVALGVIVFQFLSCYFLGYFLARFFSKNNALKTLPAMRILSFTIIFIFSIQVIKIARFYMQTWQQIHFAYQLPSAQQPTSTNGTKPNIYYFVFDRYASNKTLSEQYGYDNSNLTQFLHDQGFTVKDSASSNYPFTISSVSSTMAMDYHTQVKQFNNDSESTTLPYRSMLNDPPIAQLLKPQGYTYVLNASWWGMTADSTKADVNFSPRAMLRLPRIRIPLTESQKTLLNQTVIGPLFKQGIQIGKRKTLYIDNFSLDDRKVFFDQLNNVTNIAAHQVSPTFVFSHILVPHDPYIFDADGALPTYELGRSDIGLIETKKYTNQITYLNSQIKATVAKIRQSDPNAVIILQADEGPYPKELQSTKLPEGFDNEDVSTVTDFNQKSKLKKFGILAAYYFPGQQAKKAMEDTTSPVNVFRSVLNNYLGYGMEILPDCHYANNSDNQLEFVSMNEQLQIADDPDCSKYF